MNSVSCNQVVNCHRNYFNADYGDLKCQSYAVCLSGLFQGHDKITALIAKFMEYVPSEGIGCFYKYSAMRNETHIPYQLEAELSLPSSSLYPDGQSNYVGLQALCDTPNSWVHTILPDKFANMFSRLSDKIYKKDDPIQINLITSTRQYTSNFDELHKETQNHYGSFSNFTDILHEEISSRYESKALRTHKVTQTCAYDKRAEDSVTCSTKEEEKLLSQS
ncbi:MAG: hypothetical protein S4CHLAM6_00620 [Chlamydiae bacterium]|nr:hypothetical protein [Chlamydiota bacterium]